ncbi:universal stress protein (plasmid) [Agrobacterium sp. 13-2099-1-2]|uniref:universal stress protein n=1 Tax=Agrobacterium sp. 13-2099-1-2 TaxID=1841651 RepID=UPI00080F8CC1|nr:universal stress protein [Agrobacterium sp. 13-2099-1-2]UZX45142.1 universal stress protein [Agrobacterium sp. 13-2099-1-2]
MSFATLLQITTGEPASPESNMHFNLADAMESHLSVLLIGIASPPPVGAHMESVSAAWLDERQADQDRLARQVFALERYLKGKISSFDIEEAYTEIFNLDNVVGYRAQFADAVAIGPDILNDPGVRDAILDGALFHAGVPILVDPLRSLSWDKNSVLIAWSDAPETAAAVRASVPFLKRARSVEIIVVDPDDDRELAPGLRSYLSHQQISASIESIKSEGRTIAETIETYAERLQSSLIVMGAYGHSRLRERIFGGVTRTMIENTRRPLFLAR